VELKTGLRGWGGQRESETCIHRGEVLTLVSGGEANGEDPTLVLQIGDPVPGRIPGSGSGGGVGRKTHKCHVIGVSALRELITVLSPGAKVIRM
jgi:hypothetical protein